MAAQKRFYILRLNDPNGERAQGPYIKSEARIAQIANCGARIVTAEQLSALRERAHVKTCEYCDTAKSAPNFAYHICIGRKYLERKARTPKPNGGAR